MALKSEKAKKKKKKRARFKSRAKKTNQESRKAGEKKRGPLTVPSDPAVTKNPVGISRAEDEEWVDVPKTAGGIQRALLTLCPTYW